MAEQKTERVTVKEAARILGMSEMAVRIRMERGLLPIGDVFPSLQGKRSSYFIYRSRLEAYIKGI